MQASLNSTVRAVSMSAGHSGRIEAAYIELPNGAFVAMQAYAMSQLNESKNPKRTPYDLTSNSCVHFMKRVAEVGGARMPMVIDPRPDGYIDRVRADYPDLDFKLGSMATIEGMTLR